MKKFIYLLLLIILPSPLSLAAQTINSNTTNYWPDYRYEVHDDGTVTDTVTGLMWMQCSLGQDPDANCSGNASRYNWQQALEAAEASTFAAYSDWRLPNIKELASLVAYDRYDPAINSTIFSNTVLGIYWSASPNAFNSNEAWVLVFNDGFDIRSNRNGNSYIRLVRFTQ